MPVGPGGTPLTPLPRERGERPAAAERVSVIGAGPSGLACAIALARAKRPVVVFEAHETVGTRFHGDYQGLENWSDEQDVLSELADYGIAANFEHHPVRTGVAFDATGTRYDVGSPQPLYYLVRRGRDAGTLDTGLLAQARDLGVEVRFGERKATVEGRTVLAGGPRAADAIAVGYIFTTDMTDGCWICFDRELAPLGYAYLLVHGGRGTVASCMFSGFKREAEYLQRTVATFRERAGLRMSEPRPFGGYANLRLPRTAVQGGNLVVGEHAGFQDALAGFGMRYALRSGILAARSVIEGADYTVLWRTGLLPSLKASVSNRFLFNVTGEEGWRLMLDRLSRADTRAELRRLYRPSWWKTAVFPLAYWHFRKRLRDPSCNHVNCSCAWCRHVGLAPAAA